MCTVMFLPKDDKVIMVSCRDEDPRRPITEAPEVFVNNGLGMIYPQDGGAGGTWIGINEHGHVLILLNGAFEKHAREMNYRKSRGLIVKEMLSAQYPVSYWNELLLYQIEPFTLVIWAWASLHELVWDGHHKHHVVHDPQQPHIWSSATLYDTAAKAQRKQWFTDGLTHGLLNHPNDVLSFLQAHRDAENGFVMNRHPHLATLSIGIVEQKQNRLRFNYLDVGSNILSTQTLFIFSQIQES